jgi:uncharacterized protein (TIGR03437 family)
MRHKVPVFLPLFGILLAHAQSGPTLLGSGFAAAPSVALSPGLVMTFWVAGLNPIPGAPVQAPTPLPAELSGISLTISQSTYGKGFPLPTLPVPIISIAQTNNCYSPLTPSTPLACIVTGITVQVPYELVVDPFTMPPYTSLTVTQDGVASPAFSVATAHDIVHILTCNNAPCIARADGSLLQTGPLPVAGDILTIYLVGLGTTTPSVPTGQLTPAPAPTLNDYVFVDLVFGANAGPSSPEMNPPAGQQAKVTFAGMSPGQIGLYQINVQLPAAFPSIPACGVNGNLAVTSNLAINIGTAYYVYDGLSICVQP